MAMGFSGTSGNTSLRCMDIARSGQTATQRPHPMHRSGFILWILVFFTGLNIRCGNGIDLTFLSTFFTAIA